MRQERSHRHSDKSSSRQARFTHREYARIGIQDCQVISHKKGNQGAAYAQERSVQVETGDTLFPDTCGVAGGIFGRVETVNLATYRGLQQVIPCAMGPCGADGDIGAMVLYSY